MIKIKSGKIVSLENKFEIKTENYAVALCVLSGDVTFVNDVMTQGDCLIVPNNYAGILEAPYANAAACFELDGFEGSLPIITRTEYPESVELLAMLVEKTLENERGFLDGVSTVFQSLITVRDGEASVGNKYVDMAKRYIDANYGKQIKVEDIADFVGTDRKYLRNLFFKYLGVSTKDYLTNLRIEKAKGLLCDNSMAVNEISASVGYPDALAFSKIFKKQTGISPSDYRSGAVPQKTQKEESQAPKEDIKYFLL